MAVRGPKARTDKEWLETPWDELGVSRRRYVLLLEANHTCTQCGFNETREDGSSILEMDHIDGDHKNNSRENLRILCPNCHALTSNFRNWGRTSKKRTGSRFRRGNKGYVELQERRRQQEQAYIDLFIKTVNDTHQSGEITYSTYGWVQRLAKKMNISPQLAGRHVRKYMPDLYERQCFRRGKKRLQ